MQITTTTADALERYLDLSSAQMKLTAMNMANVDTPGYKTQGFDFEQEMSQTINSLDARSNDPQATNVEGLVARPDGNNVSMDREGLQLAKTQLQFRMGIELLKHEFASVMTAIHSEAK